MKRILFFIDPLIDNGDLLFRYPTLKHHVPVLIAGLKRQIDAGKTELRIVASDALISRARAEGVGADWPLVSLPARSLASAFQRGEDAAALWQKGGYTERHVEHYRAAITRTLDGFVPDVVIAYETAAPYMQQVFPKALIVNETWGVFSRPPMPALTTFDPVGTYQNSTLYRHMNELRALTVTPEQRETMNRIRAMVAGPLVSMDPCYEQVLAAKMDFRKVVLLPLQIDRYFSFAQCCEFGSHDELLEHVFAQMPPDVGVIVTQHQDHNPVLSDAKIDLLRKRFRNFIHFDELSHVPMLSNFLVNYVDGVITTSSAVGFHAALMKLPVFVAGKSHVSVVASGGVADVARVLDESHEADFDGVLHWMFTRYQIFTDVEQAVPENFAALIDGLVASAGQGLDAFPVRYSDQQLLELFESNSRPQYLKRIFDDKGVTYRSNELYAKIAEAKVVSYDLFDTLVERPFIEPHFLFQLIEPRIRRELGLASFAFMRFRRMAEEAARRERNWKETTLTSIYRHFRQLTGLSPEQCAQIAQIELDAEKRVLVRREPIFHTLRFAKKLGRVVSIITDIYLEEPQIRELLEAVKIREFDHLLVSATEDMRKHDGTIYPEYLGMIFRRYRVTPDGATVLHIGDNGHADCDMAKPFNIRAHVIPKSIDNFKLSRWAKVFEKNFRKRFVISDVLAGLIANRFDHSLVGRNKETLFGGSLFRAGYGAAGPMLFSFVQWLIRRVRAQGHEKVLFLARDGYLLKLIYDQIRASGVYGDLPPSGYLYVSRRAAAVPAIFGWNDIVDLYHLSFGNRKIGDFIESRFGLSKDQIDPSVLKKHGYAINDQIHQQVDVVKHLELLGDLAPAIIANAADERAALLQHFADNGLVTGRENMCVVDIGYSGSIQKYMNRIFGGAPWQHHSLQIPGGAKIAGYYLLTHEAARRSFDGVICEGFYNTYDEQRMADCHPLNDHVFLFESVLSSSEGSVVRHRYDAEGRWSMVTKESNREAERLQFMAHVHAGVTAFAADVIGSMGAYLDDVPFGPYLGSKPFFHLATRPAARDALLFTGLKVENGFGAGDAWLVYDAKPFLNKDGSLAGKARDIALGSSQWKEAAIASYTLEHERAGQVASVERQPELGAIRIKDLNLPPMVRKYLKFKKDPYRFFSDSRNPLVRMLKIFFRRYRVA